MPAILSDYALIPILLIGVATVFLLSRRQESADSLVPPRPRLNPDRKPRVVVKSEEKEAEIEARRQQERAEKGLD
jgi:hypothetical protein